jgi:phage/plasmid-like protein (TIGR03299 family)
MTTATAEPTIVKLPWSNLAEVEEGPDEKYASAEQILKAANLNWGVELKPLYHYVTHVEDGKKKQRLVKNGRFEVRRKDTEEVFAESVTDTYVPYDNEDVFAFANNLTDDDQAKFVAAGPLKGGRKVFVVMKLGKGITVAGEDAHDLYLFLRTGHDGGTALTAMVIPFRLRCLNAVPLALRTAKVRWSIPHVKSMEGRLAKARESLKLSYEYADDYAREMEKLTKTLVTDVKVEKIIESAVDLRRGNRQEVIDGIMDTYRTDPTNGYQGTGYGIIQAVTNYYDHKHPRRTDEVRLESITDGEALKVSNIVSRRLMTV